MGVVAAVLVASVCLAQTGVVYTVNSVGFVKKTVAAGETDDVSAPMTPFAIDDGTITAVGADSITDAAKDWSAVDVGPGAEGYLAFFVEVKDGANEGRYFPIMSNTADTLTVETPQDLTTLGLVGAAYCIRPFQTVQGLFSDAAGDPALSGGDSAAAASNVLAWNGTGFDTVYYSTFFGDNNWRVAGTSAAANEWPVYPDEGLLVINRDTEAAEIMSLGEVADNAKASWVAMGQGFFGNPFPANVTLANSELLEADGGPFTGGDSAAAADQVLLWTGTGYATYYYSTFFGDNTWREAGTSADATNVELESAGGFFLNNSQGAAAAWPRSLPY
jgi:uncharacterized protein (TIGR02597 family)